MVKFIVRDAREGIRRNAGAAAAAAAMIFIAMTISGALFMLRLGVHDLMQYLDAQLSMKVYVDPAFETSEVARVLEQKSYVKSVRIETKDQLVERMNVFFQGREQLLESFKESDLPDAVRLELTDTRHISLIAEELRSIRGIAQVIYPQQLAETVLHASDRINRWGLLLLLFFAGVSFLTVFLAVNLALYQRQKEIRVKLLLGAKPAHVRGQFVFEGGVIGLTGSLLAATVLDGLYRYTMASLEHPYNTIFHVAPADFYTMMLGIVAAGTAIGLCASYVSTGKLMKHA
ncbi:cell division protein FtsX [Paenibacillus naphthalenovorans]|uniref:cell division protein FtsX n=1 Tax=Paenibacillus naphthalenovorans TaxID=162209 RepID=UPI003D288C45